MLAVVFSTKFIFQISACCGIPAVNSPEMREWALRGAYREHVFLLLPDSSAAAWRKDSKEEEEEEKGNEEEEAEEGE